jgi:hypothetical protein
MVVFFPPNTTNAGGYLSIKCLLKENSRLELNLKLRFHISLPKLYYKSKTNASMTLFSELLLK